LFAGLVEVRREVRPRWPVRLPASGGPDGVLRVRGGVLERLLHVGAVPVVVRVAQRGDTVLLGAWAERRDAAEEGIVRMRFALALDDDLAPFHERFRFDPLIGPSVRRSPWLRVGRRPEPFEALAWAITEQLIEYRRAAGIQRRIVRALGRRCGRTGLYDVPSASAVAAAAPAQLQSFDLSGPRSVALMRAAREVASGRIDLHGADHERAWRRLRAIPEIGPWTIEMLALQGQGRYDQLPAGDVGYLKLVGLLRSGGDPRYELRATESDVRDFYAPYGEWKGLAGAHSLRLPVRAGTRWSSHALRQAAA
jgi:3-methyladenine DNA glycosylase/8-oxoguanine DNA glycosylase